MGINLAIKRTIKYAEKFGTYLNKDEIEERLLSKEIFSKKIINQRTKNINDKKDEYYKQKIEKARKTAKRIEESFKNILFLGVSGSVASGHPKEDSDIDFLVITKKNRLWRTRLSLRWWVWRNKIPHRKYGRKETKDEFCFNLWLDESSILLPKNRQNLRNSVDLILLKPLINRNEIYEKFIIINDWAKKWVATPYENKIKKIDSKKLNFQTKQSTFDKLINNLYFWPQYWYMKGKIKKEKIGLHEAFFHR